SHHSRADGDPLRGCKLFNTNALTSLYAELNFSIDNNLVVQQNCCDFGVKTMGSPKLRICEEINGGHGSRPINAEKFCVLIRVNLCKSVASNFLSPSEGRGTV